MSVESYQYWSTRSEVRSYFERGLHLMSSIVDLDHLGWEWLQWMSGNKPWGFDVEFVPQFQKSVDSHGSTKDTTRYIGEIGDVAVLGIDPRECSFSASFHESETASASLTSHSLHPRRCHSLQARALPWCLEFAAQRDSIILWTIKQGLAPWSMRASS